MWVWLVVAVAGRAASTSPDDLWKRLETTDIRDGAALLAFGGWCEEVELPSWAARAYDRALELPEPDPVRVEAAIALARLELKEGRHAKGYQRLRDIVRTHDQEKARELLRLGQNIDTRLQRDLLKTAEKHFESGELASARDAYVKALDKVLQGSSGADFVPPEEILKDLARCMGAIGKEETDRRAPWTRDSFQPCTQCRDGWQTCAGCKGTGRVSEVKNWAFKGKRTYTKPCDACGSLKYAVCSHCFGFGSELKSGELPEPSRAAIWRIVGKLGSLALGKGSSTLKTAIERVETIVQEDKSDLGKTYFSFIESRYSLAMPLRRELAGVPASRASLTKAEPAWKATKDFRVKFNLLSGYLCEYYRFLQGLAFLRGAKTTPDATSPPPAEAWRGSSLSLWHLASSPDSATGRWVVVDAVFEDLGTRGDMEVISAAGRPPIEAFTWLSSAKDIFEHLERASGPWPAGIRGLSKSYPFDLHTKVAGMRKGQHVRMIARVLLHLDAFPASKLEVWDIEPGLNPDQESIRQVLSQPITFTRGAFRAEELALLLKWHGLRLDSSGVRDGWRFAVTADGCPLGILIDELSKSLSSTWCLSGTTVRVSTRLPAGAVQDTRAAVTRLAGERAGTLQIAASPGEPRKH